MKSIFWVIAVLLFPALLLGQSQTTIKVDKTEVLAIAKTYDAPENIVTDYFKSYFTNMGKKVKRKGNNYVVQEVVLKDIKPQPYDVYFEISTEKKSPNKTTVKMSLSAGYAHFIEAASSTEIAGITKFLDERVAAINRERVLSELSVHEKQLTEQNQKLKTLESQRTSLDSQIMAKQKEIQDISKTIEGLRTNL